MEKKFSLYIIVFLDVVEYSTPLPVHECTEMSTKYIMSRAFFENFLSRVCRVSQKQKWNPRPLSYSTGVCDLA